MSECKECGGQIIRRKRESMTVFRVRSFCKVSCSSAYATKQRIKKIAKCCDVCGGPTVSANVAPRVGRPRLYCGNDCRTIGLARKRSRRLENRRDITDRTRTDGISPAPGEYSDSIPVTVPYRQVVKDTKRGRQDHVESIEQRPITRGDCKDMDRPCPWVSCKYNLYLDIGNTGSLKLHFPHQDPTEVKYSCALDVADKGGVILKEVGAATNVSRERARQVEDSALVTLRQAMKRAEKAKL